MSDAAAKEPSTLFPVEPAWKDKWAGMPEFRQEDKMPWQSIKVHFRNEEDRRAFSELVGQKVLRDTLFIWYPESKRKVHADKRWIASSDNTPRYPLYVISKGRWESRLTSRALEAIGVPYRIVVEPQEKDQYAAVIAPEKILVLPFSNLGQGGIPARNWVWEHAKASSAARHWIIDDNIRDFERLHNNVKIKCADGTPFRVIEDWVDCYENVAIAGPNYRSFAKQNQEIPPFVLNTRVYSCILIRNDLPYRWRGRYNEDTDLCLRALKDGWCTVLFNAFLAYKETTCTMKGGNTDELYKGDGRLKMAQSLQEQHPDLVTITTKWGRPQHQVNYHVFKQRLKLKPGVVLPSGPNEYGLELQHVDPTKPEGGAA